jgi:hypothetical protein
LEISAVGSTCSPPLIADAVLALFDLARATADSVPVARREYRPEKELGAERKSTTGAKDCKGRQAIRDVERCKKEFGATKRRSPSLREANRESHGAGDCQRAIGDQEIRR